MINRSIHNNLYIIILKIRSCTLIYVNFCLEGSNTRACAAITILGVCVAIDQFYHYVNIYMILERSHLLNLMASPVFSLLQLPVGASQSQRHTTIIWRNLKTCSAVGDIPYASRYSSALVLQYLMLYMHKILVFMLPSCLATNLWIIGWGRHLGGTTVGTHLLIL